MGLPRHQRPGGQLLPGVDVRGQEAAGVHLPGGLPVLGGGGPVGLRGPGSLPPPVRAAGNVLAHPLTLHSTELPVL